MQQLITQLLDDVQLMQDKYESVKASGEDYDFYLLSPHSRTILIITHIPYSI